MLSSDEVADFWQLAIPLEARYVPDEPLALAIAEGRVQTAVSWSSMGTAETYWDNASRRDTASSVRGDGVVYPPGEQPVEWSWNDRLDDRDVIGCLWEPFWSDQRRRLAARLPEDQRDRFLEECARMLVELEPREPALAERTLLIDWLIAADEVDRNLLDAELSKLAKRESLRHLAHGVHARWISRDVAAGFAAVVQGAARSKSEANARIALLRFGVRLALDRSP